jgi:type I restriction enzyme S subunit
MTYNKSNESKNGKGYRLLCANNITLSTNTLNFDDIKIIEDSVKIKDGQWLKESDILICAGSESREHIGKVAFINNDIDCTFSGFMGVLRVKSILDSRFLFHVLTGNIFSKHLDMSLDTSTINNLNSAIMNGLKIPLPPLAEQQRIVAILDRFDTLVNDLTNGLPAEIEARRKQYAYYRDKLLTFPEAHV